MAAAVVAALGPSVLYAGFVAGAIGFGAWIIFESIKRAERRIMREYEKPTRPPGLSKRAALWAMDRKPPRAPAVRAAIIDAMHANAPHNTIANFSVKAFSLLEMQGVLILAMADDKIPAYEKMEEPTHVLVVRSEQPGKIAAYPLKQQEDKKLDAASQILDAVAKSHNYVMDHVEHEGNLTVSHYMDRNGSKADKWGFGGPDSEDDLMAAMRHAGIRFGELSEKHFKEA